MRSDSLFRIRRTGLAVLTAFFLSCASAPPASTPDRGTPAPPLPSWNGTPAKSRILDFVATVTDETSPRFVPRERRVATFDLDGTLIVERPDYVEVLVAVQALREDLAKDPSLSTRQPWQAVAEDDADSWRQHAEEVLLAAARGDSLSDYHRQVRRYLTTAVHPQLERTYASLFYEPMIELIELLRAHEFSIYVVSDSQQEYMRAFSQACLGVAPPRIVGSMIAFRLREGTTDFLRTDQWWQPLADGDGKAERIRERIAALPIFAAGNSGGDQEMLELTSQADPSLVLLLDHDDAEREFEYHHEAMLEEAGKADWVTVSMKEDWATIFGHRCSW